VQGRITRLAGKHKPPLHLRKELAESQHHVQEVLPPPPLHAKARAPKEVPDICRISLPPLPLRK